MDGSDVVLDSGRGGSAEKAAKATRGFLRTRQNASISDVPRVHPGNVGLRCLSPGEGTEMSEINRRTILGGASALAAGALAAPAVRAQGGKPYAGTTINAACFQTTYFEYLKAYFPRVRGEDRHQGQFHHAGLPGLQPAHRPRAVDQGLGLDVVNVTFIYSGRWIGAGWLTNLDNFTKDAKMHAGRLGRRRISSAARNRRCRTPRARPSATPGQPAP